MTATITLPDTAQAGQTLALAIETLARMQDSLRTAQNNLDETEARIDAGDDSIDADDLMRCRTAVEIATRQRDAAESNVKRAERAMPNTDVQLAQAVAEILTGPGLLEDIAITVGTKPLAKAPAASKLPTVHVVQTNPATVMGNGWLKGTVEATLYSNHPMIRLIEGDRIVRELERHGWILQGGITVTNPERVGDAKLWTSRARINISRGFGLWPDVMADSAGAAATFRMPNSADAVDEITQQIESALQQFERVKSVTCVRKVLSHREQDGHTVARLGLRFDAWLLDPGNPSRIFGVMESALRNDVGKLLPGYGRITAVRVVPGDDPWQLPASKPTNVAQAHTATRFIEVECVSA